MSAVMTPTKAKNAKSKKSPRPSHPAAPASEGCPIPQNGRRVSEKAIFELVHVSNIVVDATPNRAQAPTAESIEELARSMAMSGLQHPIGVTPFGLEGEPINEKGRRYRLVWGARRLEAAKRLGWGWITASVRLFESEQELIIDRGTENFQRLQMTPVDEALLVAHVLAVFEAQAALGPTAEPAQGEQPNLPVPIAHQVEARKVAVRKAAEYFGKSEVWVRDRGFLARLGKEEQELVASGRLPLGHAREICKVADPEARVALALQAAARNPNNHARWDSEFPMPFEDLRQLVSQQVLSLHQVPWDLVVPFAGKPACVECPHNSANIPGLFDGGARISADPASARSRQSERITKEPKAGACTNRACYAVKLGTAKRALQTTARRLVKEAKELPVKQRPDFKRMASLVKMETEIPEFLPRAAVASAAVEASKPKKASDRIETVSYSYRPDPKQEAKRKLDEALEQRSKHIEPRLAKRLSEVPGAWAMYTLFRVHRLVRSTQDHNARPEKLARIFSGSEFKALAGLILSPSVEAMVRIEKGCGREFKLLEHWYDGPSGFADAIAAELGVDADELGPRPTLEDFMPKATKIEKPAEGPSAPARASRSKKSKKPASEPGRERAGVDDVGEDKGA